MTFFFPSLSFESSNGRAINTLSHQWAWRATRLDPHVEPRNVCRYKSAIWETSQRFWYIRDCFAFCSHDSHSVDIPTACRGPTWKQHIFAWDCGLYLINTILWFQELVKIWFWRKGFLSSTDNPSSWLVQSNVLLHLLEVLLCCPGQLNKEWVSQPSFIHHVQLTRWLQGVLGETKMLAGVLQRLRSSPNFGFTLRYFGAPRLRGKGKWTPDNYTKIMFQKSAWSTSAIPGVSPRWGAQRWTFSWPSQLLFPTLHACFGTWGRQYLMHQIISCNWISNLQVIFVLLSYVGLWSSLSPLAASSPSALYCVSKVWRSAFSWWTALQWMLQFHRQGKGIWFKRNCFCMVAELIST